MNWNSSTIQPTCSEWNTIVVPTNNTFWMCAAMGWKEKNEGKCWWAIRRQVGQQQNMGIEQEANSIAINPKSGSLATRNAIDIPLIVNNSIVFHGNCIPSKLSHCCICTYYVIASTVSYNRPNQRAITRKYFDFFHAALIDCKILICILHTHARKKPLQLMSQWLLVHSTIHARTKYWCWLVEGRRRIFRIK